MNNVPPHDSSAEKSVLGSIFLDWKGGLDRALQVGIKSDSFYVPAHRLIFQAVSACSVSGKPIDLTVISDILKAQGNIERVGGSVYLESCVDETPTASHLEYYADIVRKKALCRAVMNQAMMAVVAAGEPDADIEQVRSRAEYDMAILAAESPALASRSNADIFGTQIENWKKAQTIGSAGLPSGFMFWDKNFGGFMECGLYIVSGKPGCGKTTLCRNIVENLVLNENLPVAVSSLEMTAEQYLGAMACRISKQNAFNLNSGHKGVDLVSVKAAGEEVIAAPLFIQDRPQTVVEFASWARRMVGHNKARLIVLDYAQRLRPDQKYGSEEARYADYSVSLVNLAKELRVPLLVVARESDQGGLYGARQWEYDAWAWLRMQREAQRPNGSPRFTATVEKNRFGPLSHEDLEMVVDGGYLRPVMTEEEQQQRSDLGVEE